MFLTSKYSEFISQHQASDKNRSFSNGTIPDWYAINNEPRSSSGKNLCYKLIMSLMLFL